MTLPLFRTSFETISVRSWFPKDILSAAGVRVTDPMLQEVAEKMLPTSRR